MNETEQIKKLEEEIARKIENEKLASEKKIAELKAKKQQMVQEKISEAEKEAEKEFKREKKNAEKEAEKITEGVAVELKKIEERANKNFNVAINKIIEEFSKI